MDISDKNKRVCHYLDMVSKCDNPLAAQKILIEKIIDLECCLNELQENYFEIITKFKNFQCVPDQF